MTTKPQQAFHFPDKVFCDVKRWAQPVVAYIEGDSTLREFLGNDGFLRDLATILDGAYHLTFVEDSDPSSGLGLEVLAKYSPEVRERVLVALGEGSDPCGYIHQNIR
jgi:hypothetical protein